MRRKKIIIKRHVDRVELLISKESEIENVANIKLMVFLLGVYSEACQEGDRDVFQDMVPEKSKKKVQRILKMATKHSIFETIFYRSTRPWGYLTAPIRTRKLVVDEDSIPISSEFYEIVFERLTEDEEVDRFKVEMDRMELEVLIEELQEILGEEEE